MEWVLLLYILAVVGTIMALAYVLANRSVRRKTLDCPHGRGKARLSVVYNKFRGRWLPTRVRSCDLLGASETCDQACIGKLVTRKERARQTPAGESQSPVGAR